MKRIAIVGSGGSGKSTLARKIGEITGIEIFHLDKLFWKPGWKHIPKGELEDKIREIAAWDSWIIDGNYSSTMDLRFRAADTIIFLDLPLWTCLWGIARRRLMYEGRTRPDITEGCYEKLDWEFFIWVITFPFRRKKDIYRRLNSNSVGKNVFVLKSRRQIEKYIRKIKSGDYSA